MLISWAVSKERGRFIWPSSPRPEHSFAAQDCRAIIARLHPGKSNTRRNGTARENALLFPSSLPGTPAPIFSEQAVNVLFVRNRAAYEVRRFRTARGSLALSVHLSTGFAVIRGIVL